LNENVVTENSISATEAMQPPLTCWRQSRSEAMNLTIYGPLD